MIPAQTHFQRHGNVDGTDRGLDQAKRVIEIAHQRRAGQALGHLAGRTAHIDVDNVGSGISGNFGALGHPVRLAPGQLDHAGCQRGIQRRLANHVAAACGQCIRGDHFRYHHAGPETLGLATEGQIGHAGHGREDRGNINPVRAD